MWVSPARTKNHKVKLQWDEGEESGLVAICMMTTVVSWWVRGVLQNVTEVHYQTGSPLRMHVPGLWKKVLLGLLQPDPFRILLAAYQASSSETIFLSSLCNNENRVVIDDFTIFFVCRSHFSYSNYLLFRWHNDVRFLRWLKFRRILAPSPNNLCSCLLAKLTFSCME